MAMREIKMTGLAGARHRRETRRQPRMSTHKDQSPQSIDWPTFETGDERVYDFNRNQGSRNQDSRRAAREQGFDREGIVSRVRSLPHLGRRSCVGLLLRLRNRPLRAQLE